MRVQLWSILALPLLHVYASEGDQIIMTDPIIQQSMQPTLADLLTIESSASIFYSYARELTLSNMLSEVGGSPITLLVPTNKAVIALPRKPHQGSAPVDTGVVITEQEYDALSKENVERWVSGHIIPQSPISFDQTYLTLLDGKSITFTLEKGDPHTPDWSRAVIGDTAGKKALDGNNVRIIGKREASNGVLFLIDGTISID